MEQPRRRGSDAVPWVRFRVYSAVKMGRRGIGIELKPSFPAGRQEHRQLENEKVVNLFRRPAHDRWFHYVRHADVPAFEQAGWIIAADLRPVHGHWSFS